MIDKRIRSIVLLVVLVVLMYAFFSTIHTPRDVLSSEFTDEKLRKYAELETYQNFRANGKLFRPNSKARLPAESTVRQQLSFQFPFEPAKGFQKNIWQTWKVPLDDPDFPPKFKELQSTWTTNNPDYKHYVLPDDACHELINQQYATVPHVVEAYNSMPKSILKADFFRYLILFARGGVYSDIDTRSIKPIDKWMSGDEKIYDKKNPTSIAIGIEADPNRPDWEDWYARRIQLCQWTIQAKKGHPLLRELIANITDTTLTRKRNGQLTKVLGKDEGGDIMNWTGPGIFTDFVFKYLNNIVLSSQGHAGTEDPITWKLFTGISLPVVVDDVMILPITSFSPGVNQMGAQSTSDPMAYAEHLFSGSWKPEDERM
ncbi:putative glycosyltransferase Hoc1p [[Candida] anglica]|uniref:Glycosyltransferase Hoc1p n=1 Tax=[Candida] anglica TaxID=148631 RepID=A0ABP0EMD3_9ASCO